MNKIFCIIVSLLLVIPGANNLSAQEEWKLKEEKEGIRIYSRANEFSDFDEFKAITESEHSIHAFIAVLKDIPAIPEWMYSVTSSRFLEAQGDTLQIYYTEAKAPFPLKNRDGIYLNRFRWDRDEQALIVDIEILPAYIEEEDNLVRISRGRGSWKVKEVRKGTVEITFQMQVDPGGSIPSWLANMFVVDTPFHTLTELKRMMALEKYQGKRYGVVEE